MSGGKGFVAHLDKRYVENRTIGSAYVKANSVACWITPLVDGEPWPGETWEHDHYGAVEILSQVADSKYVHVRANGDRTDWLVARDRLTRIPPTREVAIAIGDPLCKIISVTVPADMTDDEVRRRVVGALGVGS